MAIGVTENTFQLNIVSAEGPLFSGPAHALAISGSDGELGIRPGHSPLLSRLKPGVASFVTDLKDPEEILYISGGIVEVQPDQVIVLADVMERAKDLNEAATENAKIKAESAVEKAKKMLAEAEARLKALKILKGVNSYYTNTEK